MKPLLKICGIRRPEDVQYINTYIPDYAGFILSKPFRRYVPPELFRTLVQELDGVIGRVGVFVDPTMEKIRQYAEYLDVIQLHGNETAELISQIREELPDTQIWKAVRVRTAQDIAAADALPVDSLVLDSFSAVSHGGTGTLAPWDVIIQNRPEKPFFLAGGIDAENVQAAIREVQPLGVDASSSVETDGCKDLEKIRELVYQVRTVSVQGEDFMIPPAHVRFLAKRLYGSGTMKDVSLAHIEPGGGGPLKLHTHAHDHLFIVTEGEVCILLGDKKVILKKNESFLVTGTVPHAVWNHSREMVTMIGITVCPI
ncbi:MAG: cupin domain-containing protein [Oscillospiraceae bacterium]|nr:cupin domain-containing protein [Oscillospiraceae bacterium]